MKTSLLTPILVCITVLLTFWIFRDFQKQWKAASTFHAIVSDTQLSMRHLFISPEQLGVHVWNVGDFATYQLKTNTDYKQITFHVAVRSENPSRNEFWLRTEGLVRLNGVNVDLWRLLGVKSLRPGSESAKVLFAPGAIPFHLQQRRAPPHPVLLEPVGEENVKTESGTFKCQHYFAYLQAPDGSKAPLLELWANSSVRPIGIVRARWRDEVLELVQTQTLPLREIPSMLSKTIHMRQGRNIHTVDTSHAPSVCTQCHDGEIGGKHLKLESLTAISGIELSLTESLHHVYTADLADPHNRLVLQLISQREKRLASESVQFTWARGSFKVQTNPNGHLVLSLDEIARQSNMRVSTGKGRMVLKASPPPM